MFRVIMQDMSRFFYRYAGTGSRIGIIVFVFVFVSVALRARMKKESIWQNWHVLFHAVSAALLAMYLYIAVGITLLSRSEEYSPIINLRLFSTFGGSFTDRMYIYENILLLAPLGILLFILAKPFRNPMVSLLTGAAASLTIETAQVLTRRGRFEVDDLLTNTIGMMLGYCSCRLPATIYRKWKLGRVNIGKSFL